MWLPWEYAIALAVIVAIASTAIRHRWPALSAVGQEVTIVSLLYALWQYAGKLSLLGIEDALERGQQVWDFERAMGLPNELALQEAMLPYSVLTQIVNIFYAVAHVPAMGVFLVWMFFRHRDSYPRWRNALALMTGACLVIQLVPVSPPRLTDGTGMIDSGLAYGQSVYGALGRGIAGQLQAMPSIHVGWAALIGWASTVESTSRWRYIGLAHFAATFMSVAATGNHYWLDGLVAMALLVPAVWLGTRIQRAIAQFSQAHSGQPDTDADHVVDSAVARL